MKLLMTIGEYLARSPVYSLEVPQYLEEVQGVTRDEYFQRGMLQVQRIINAYMQGYFQKRGWDISTLYESKQEEIKDILFEEFQYLHENQMWFVKSNDITYSTAGQQTFTYSTNLDDNNFSLIPNHVKRMILNTHLLDYANGEFEVDDRAIAYDNQFSDGVFVPEVAWGDKADNTMVINGQNVKLADAINDLRRTKISIDDERLVHSLKITDLMEDNNTDTITLQNRIISSNQYYGNKKDFDFAQVKDLRDVWIEADKAIQNNTKSINNAIGLISTLNTQKLDTSTATNLLANKANLDLKNVNMGIQPTMKYLIVKSTGELDTTSTSGDLKVIKWTSEQEFVSGQACYVVEQVTENQQTKPYAFLYVATDKAGNKNKFPKENPDYWSNYSLPIDLGVYVTAEEVANTYLPLSGNQGMRGDLNMSGNNVTNAANLVEFSDINDSTTGNKLLWSSTKTQSELNKMLNKVTTSAQSFQSVVTWLKQQIFALGIDVRYNNSTISSLITTESNGDLKLASNTGVVKDKNNNKFLTTPDLNGYVKASVANTWTATQTFSNGSDTITINGSRIDLNGSADIYCNGSSNYLYGNLQVASNARLYTSRTSFSDTDYINKKFVNDNYMPKLKQVNIKMKEFSITWKDTSKISDYCMFYFSYINNFKQVLRNKLGANFVITSVMANGYSEGWNTAVLVQLGMWHRVEVTPINYDSLFDNATLYISFKGQKVGDVYNRIINSDSTYLTFTYYTY